MATFYHVVPNSFTIYDLKENEKKEKEEVLKTNITKEEIFQHMGTSLSVPLFVDKAKAAEAAWKDVPANSREHFSIVEVEFNGELAKYPAWKVVGIAGAVNVPASECVLKKASFKHADEDAVDIDLGNAYAHKVMPKKAANQADNQQNAGVSLTLGQALPYGMSALAAGASWLFGVSAKLAPIAAKLALPKVALALSAASPLAVVGAAVLTAAVAYAATRVTVAGVSWAYSGIQAHTARKQQEREAEKAAATKKAEEETAKKALADAQAQAPVLTAKIAALLTELGHTAAPAKDAVVALVQGYTAAANDAKDPNGPIVHAKKLQEALAFLEKDKATPVAERKAFEQAAVTKKTLTV